MDDLRVAAIAVRHRAMQGLGQAEPTDTSAAVDELLRRQLDEHWNQFASECQAFCDAYNRAFTAERIYCQPHDDAIVVRSSDDSQETVTFTRMPHASAHQSQIAAHRYSSHAAPVDLPLGTRVDGRTVTLIAENRPVTVEDAVILFLEQFTGEISSRALSE
jgi:hypothetical protein